MQARNHRLIFIFVTLTLLSGCRSIYYNFWESFGKEKRDLLTDQIATTNHSQDEVRQEFKDTLDRIRHQYKFDGGLLKKPTTRWRKILIEPPPRLTTLRARLRN